MASKNVEEKLETLIKRVDKLERDNERLHDVHKIQNLIVKEALLFEAHLHEERLNLVAQKTHGVTIEWGARGVFEGYQGARRTFIGIEESFEKSHAAGMKKLYPDVKLPAENAGMLESQLVGLPVIEVAGDGKTAKAVWISMMAIGKTHEQDPKPTGQFLWWKSAIDFVKEDGIWKIWHYLKNPVFLAPSGKDWMEMYLNMPVLPSPGSGKGLPGSHGGNPDRSTTRQYNPYRITRLPSYEPVPPEPYETFNEKNSYSY
jgi:hypothetical protein